MGVLAALDRAIAFLEGMEGVHSDAVKARAAVAELIAERDALHALINNPQTDEFLPAVRAEAAHQVQRWGTVHDRAKEPADWFWLVGYLAGKALRSHIEGDTHKALHHTISSGAALAHWHAAIKHGASLMTPGASDLQESLAKAFGANVGSAS
ncbi:MAG: hypothetical protein WA777_19975 [Rhodanobacter sp.]